MPQILSVQARPWIDGKAVELVITGCLTDSTRDALAAEIATARGPGAAVHVLVDLNGAQQIDPSALELLRADVDDLELLRSEESEDPSTAAGPSTSAGPSADMDPAGPDVVQMPVMFLLPETTRAASLEKTTADDAP